MSNQVRTVTLVIFDMREKNGGAVLRKYGENSDRK